MRAFVLYVVVVAVAKKRPSIAENGKDAFGCSIVVGETWCAAQKRCVQLYEPCLEVAAGDTRSCMYSWAGLTWDLSPLQRSAHYVVRDALAAANVSYVVGICMDVAAPNAACVSTTGSAREVATDAAPAYQLVTTGSGTECFRCGASVTNESAASWGLLDPANPAAGVALRYEGGNTCSAATPTKRSACAEVVGTQSYCRRSMTIQFVCNNRITAVTEIAQVKELSGCEYEVKLNSQYGCPLECPRGGGSVCHSRGVCGYDGVEAGLTIQGAKGKALCACKPPWTGPSCGDVLVMESDEIQPKNWLFWAGVWVFVAGLLLLAYAKRTHLLVLISGIVNLGRPDDDRPHPFVAKHRGYQQDDDEDDGSSNPFLATSAAPTDLTVNKQPKPHASYNKNNTTTGGGGVDDLDDDDGPVLARL